MRTSLMARSLVRTGKWQ
jgi:hypothetical protein